MKNPHTRSKLDQTNNSWLNRPLPQARQTPATRMKTTSNSRPGAAASPPRKHRKRKVILAFLAILLIAIVVYGGSLLGSIDKLFHGNIVSDITAFIHPAKLAGENQGRVNILLAGYDPNADESNVTDSIMVVSIDTKNNTAFLFSVPRDLWVNIPGAGHEKINAANDQSSFHQSGYFPGGIGDLQSIIENDFGIPINYYALVDYTALQDAVNSVGGITVNIQSPDPRGLYDPNVDKAHGGPLKLPNGPVTLNGRSALALALARGDSYYAYGFPTSDINRTQHQRQMLIALVQKASSAGVLANPVKVTSLVSSLGNNVKTDFTLADVLRLDKLIKPIQISSVQSYGLSYGGHNPLLKSYSAPDGESALIPKAGLNNYSQIQAYYQSLVQNENNIPHK